MGVVLQNRAIAKLPVTELEDAPSAFLEPVLLYLLEKRLREEGVILER